MYEFIETHICSPYLGSSYLVFDYKNLKPEAANRVFTYCFDQRKIKFFYASVWLFSRLSIDF